MAQEGNGDTGAGNTPNMNGAGAPPPPPLPNEPPLALWKRLAIGGIGGLLPLVATLFVKDVETLNGYWDTFVNGVNTGAPLMTGGYILRGTFLFLAGAFVVWFQNTGNDPKKILQFGMAAPGLLASMVLAYSAQNALVKPDDAPEQGARSSVVGEANASDGELDEQSAQTLFSDRTALAKVLSGFLGQPTSLFDLPVQKKQTVYAVVNVLEGQKIEPDYDFYIDYRTDVEYGLTYATLNSGTLATLVKSYLDRAAPSSAAAKYLRENVDKIDQKNQTLIGNAAFKTALTDAAKEPAMKSAQISAFRKGFWKRAVRIADDEKVRSPLGLLIVYDSVFVGDWSRVVANTEQKLDKDIDKLPESTWVPALLESRDYYIDQRNLPDGVKKRQHARIAELRALVDTGNWDLNLPVKVAQTEITPDTLKDW